jgi:hypothetical protein
MNTKTTTVRAYLECRLDDGTTAFYSYQNVLSSPNLQSRCIEKRELRRIMKTCGKSE